MFVYQIEIKAHSVGAVGFKRVQGYHTGRGCILFTYAVSYDKSTFSGSNRIQKSAGIPHWEGVYFIYLCCIIR